MKKNHILAIMGLTCLFVLIAIFFMNNRLIRQIEEDSSSKEVITRMPLSGSKESLETKSQPVWEKEPGEGAEAYQRPEIEPKNAVKPDYEPPLEDVILLQ